MGVMCCSGVLICCVYVMRLVYVVLIVLSVELLCFFLLCVYVCVSWNLSIIVFDVM